VSRVRGGEVIRRAAHGIRKFKGRDFLLWNLASLLNRQWPRSFSYTDNRGLRFVLDLTDPAYRALYLFGQYEWDLLWCIDNLLDPGDTFVEAGTSVGLYTTLAAKRVGPQGKVIGFEPLDSARQTAERHAQLNDLRNVSIAPMALGASHGRAEIFSFGGLPTGHASLVNLAPEASGQSCEVTTIDSMLSTSERGRLRLIKLDVEGSEFAAIRGAGETISAMHPRVIIESNAETSRAFGYSFDELAAWFYERGYRAFLWRGNAWTERVESQVDGRPHNVLFVWKDDSDALRRVSARPEQG
jgi:FkbM family methyltransferase